MEEEEKLYVGQLLKLTLIGEYDITDYTEKAIKYKSPSGVTAQVDPTVDNADHCQLTFQYTNEINEKGTWKFWINVTFSNGELISEPIELYFNTEGE